MAEADPDWQLVAQCRAGRREAFDELVLRHQDRLYTLARRLLGDHGEAEELAQDTFLRAYENIEQFRGEARFSTWLHRICYNLCMNNLKRKKADPAGQPEPEVAGGSVASVHDDLMVNERRELVNRALSRLKDEFREVLVLYHTEHQSYEEIAALLEVQVGTVRSRLHRGREQLKELLRPYLKED